VAQEGYDKLMTLTDSRYRLSMIVARRAAQLKAGIPTTLSPEERPKTRNTVTIAIHELVNERGIRWGDDLPSPDELAKTVERDREAEAAPYSVSRGEARSRGA